MATKTKTLTEKVKAGSMKAKVATEPLVVHVLPAFAGAATDALNSAALYLRERGDALNKQPGQDGSRLLDVAERLDILKDAVDKAVVARLRGER